jgi:hypothetical protein
MTALADMEELLASINNRDMIDYMHEALACYGAKAYRGCIVMSYLALFDDLKFKLEELAKLNATARTIWQEVKKRSGNQEVFESYMADQLQKAGLLTKSEHKQLEMIRDIRNRAAHPSGVHAKAEEARYVYRVVIDDFLSQKLLRTTHAADALLARLAQGNLFPSNDFDENVEIAKSEIAEINPAAHAYLITKLVAARSGPALESNSGRMIAALTAIGDAPLRTLICKKLIEDQSHDPEYGLWIGRVISAAGTILKDLKAGAPARVRSLLVANTEKPPSRVVTRLSHPATQLASMLSGLGEEAVLKTYEPFVAATLQRYPYASPILDVLGDAPKVRDRLIEIWLENAGSATFDTANAFAAAAPELDDYTEANLSEEKAFRIILAVIKAAEWNARTSKRLRTNRFLSMPKIREMALCFAKKKKKTSGGLINEILPGTTLADFLKDELDAE